jgi:acyl-[acyl-carrier-protein]-phospholipid O-acyltransferase/long-chain-fatty-acid--[acyl-carrier-protein] ligase
MIQFLARILLRMMFRVEVQGLPPASKPERLLVVPNHQAFTDGLLAQAFLPIQVTWIVHSQIVAKWYFRFLLRGIPHLAVDAANPMSMKKVVHLIESGTPVGIFPEGRITVTGSLMKIYEGTAFLAARTGATILPVRIEGAAHSSSGG